MTDPAMSGPGPEGTWPPPVFWGAMGILAGGLVAFSQLGVWFWDEGWDLLAAQLALRGRVPYRDFFHQHGPLYVSVAAAWMWLVGDTWRSAHILSALGTATAVVTVAAFVWSRLPDPRWRGPAAVTAAALTALDLAVIRFGTLAQVYGLCLGLVTAAFYLTAQASARGSPRLALAAGVCAGGGAASVLAAPVVPVLGAWLVSVGRSARPARTGRWFVAGVAASSVPTAWLFVQAPRQMALDLGGYHLLLRMEGRSILWHDLNTLTGWLDGSQSLMLALLAAVGLAFALRGGTWTRRPRAEAALLGWLSAALAVWLALPRPTFSRYFVLLVPFLAILGAFGTWALGTRVVPAARPAWVVVAVIALFSLGLGRAALQQRGDLEPRWPDLEEVAQVVNRVTPPDAEAFMDESLYFLTRRRPPSGLESHFGRSVALLPPVRELLHVATAQEIDGWLSSGRFATVTICYPDERKIEQLRLPTRYGSRRVVRGCHIFADRIDGR